MTPKQISLVKASWRGLMRTDPLLLGGLFYDKLFHDNPGAEALFSNSRDEQAKKLIEMINVVIMRLEKLQELTEDIRQLAIRHVGYGTKNEHYGLVGAALLWTLEKGLGREWNAELAEAWTICYTTLSQTMIQAADEFKLQETK